LRNHAESSIHTKEVHPRSILSPNHPSLSQDLTMLSLVLEILRKIGRGK
jgi:hypothetical protein